MRLITRRMPVQGVAETPREGALSEGRLVAKRLNWDPFPIIDELKTCEVRMNTSTINCSLFSETGTEKNSIEGKRYIGWPYPHLW